MKQLLDKYKHMPKPIKASFWYTVCSVLGRSVSFITLPIFTYLLTTSDYGLCSVYETWSGLIALFATLNLQYGSFSVAMVKFEDDQKCYISAVQGLSTVCTLGIFGIYFIFRDPLNPMLGLTTPLMIAMCLQLIVQPGIAFWSGMKRYHYEYREFVILTMLQTIVSPCIMVAAVLLVDENRGAVRIYGHLVSILFFAGGIYIYNFIKGKAFYVKKYWKFALGFNIPLLPYYLSQSIFNQSDRLMIAKMCGNHKAGIYSVAYTLGMVLNLVLSAINNSYVPWQYKRWKAKERPETENVTDAIALLIAALLLLIILCAPEVIAILTTKEYYEARWVVPPVAASLLLLFITQIFINLEFYFEEKKFLVVGSILSAVVNVVLNAIFIPIFGFAVAGYTTLFSYIMFAFCNYLCAKNVLQKHWKGVRIQDVYNIKILVLITGIFLLLVFGIVMVYDYIWLRYAFMFVICVIGFIKRRTIIERYKEM